MQNNQARQYEKYIENKIESAYNQHSLPKKSHGGFSMETGDNREHFSKLCQKLNECEDRRTELEQEGYTDIISYLAKESDKTDIKSISKKYTFDSPLIPSAHPSEIEDVILVDSNFSGHQLPTISLQHPIWL